MKTLIIRCDASDAVGHGHEMRCLSLAMALREQKIEALFLCREHTNNIKACGFDVQQLNCDCQHHDVCDEEIALICKMAGRSHTVLIDHYGFKASHHTILKKHFKKLIAIHDFPEKNFPSADYVLIPQHNNELVLLRDEFLRTRKETPRQFVKENYYVLLSMGGGNTEALIGDVLKLLENCSQTLSINCLTTSHGAYLEECAANSSHHVRIFENPDHVSKVMGMCDLAISAGGSTCWELACLGVPMLLVELEYNQRGIISKLVAEDCAVECLLDDSLSETITGLIHAPEKRRMMSANGRKLIDGKGAHKTARIIADVMEAEHDI